MPGVLVGRFICVYLRHLRIKFLFEKGLENIRFCIHNKILPQTLAMMTHGTHQAALEATSDPGLIQEIAPIQERLAKLPILDARSMEEILGYDDSGFPT